MGHDRTVRRAEGIRALLLLTATMVGCQASSTEATPAGGPDGASADTGQDGEPQDGLAPMNDRAPSDDGGDANTKPDGGDGEDAPSTPADADAAVGDASDAESDRGDKSCVPAGQSVVLSTLDYPFELAVDDSRVFFSQALVPPYGRVLSVTIQTPPVETVLAFSQPAVAGVAADSQHAYWVTKRGSVARIPKAGGAVELMATAPGQPNVLALDGTDVYFLSSGPAGEGQVLRMPKSGGNPVVLAGGQFEPNAIALDDNAVYWTNFGDGSVHSVPKLGGQDRILAANQGSPGGIAADQDAVYWSSFSGGFISAMRKGETPRLLSSQHAELAAAVALDANHVYWITNALGTGKVVAVPKTGGPPVVLACGLRNGHAIAVDRDHVYYSTAVTAGVVAKIRKPWL
jgi:hypothetical protein